MNSLNFVFHPMLDITSKVIIEDGLDDCLTIKGALDHIKERSNHSHKNDVSSYDLY